MPDDHRSDQDSGIEYRSPGLLGRIMLVEQIHQNISGNLGAEYHPAVVGIKLIAKRSLKSDQGEQIWTGIGAVKCTPFGSLYHISLHLYLIRILKNMQLSQKNEFLYLTARTYPNQTQDKRFNGSAGKVAAASIAEKCEGGLNLSGPQRNLSAQALLFTLNIQRAITQHYSLLLGQIKSWGLKVLPLIYYDLGLKFIEESMMPISG